MRILLCSHWFYPSIGGVETISRLLAEEFTAAGNQVTVVTNSTGPEMDVPYTVIRQPSRATLRELAKQSDVVMQNLISLRTLVAVAFNGKPIVVTHQSWLRQNDGTRGLENYLKLVALRFCYNVSISKAIAAALPVSSVIVGNPFESKEFEHLRSVPKDLDIVFLGRLVSDKGCDVLLRALAILRGKGLTPSLTVIGDGPEATALKAMTKELDLEAQVQYLGSMQQGRGEVVARHKIMAVPSVWAEPFGVVALEGIGAGCAIVASAQGGLPDAAGDCGLYFPNGDAAALAAALETLLRDSTVRERLVENGPRHLNNFRPDVVAGKYLEIFRGLLKR